MVDIKSFIDRKHMSKADLARALDIDPKTSVISAYEKGRAGPSYSVCKKLLVLGMSVQELFGKEVAEKTVIFTEELANRDVQNTLTKDEIVAIIEQKMAEAKKDLLK